MPASSLLEGHLQGGKRELGDSRGSPLIWDRPFECAAILPPLANSLAKRGLL